MLRILQILCVLIATPTLSPQRLAAATINVFAAASLTDSLKAIAADYERKTGDKAVFNFAASSVLARQIEEGAPADVFFSADELKMDGLEKRGLLLKETRQSRLSNALVIVVASEKGAAVEGPKDLTTDKVKRLALAEPRTVPAGLYAKEYLQKQNLWTAVKSKIVPTENVRAALSAVEAGNADAGIVYKTDASMSRRVRVAYQIPDQDSPRISYSMAVLKDSRDPTAGRRLLRHLESDEAGKVFVRFGFMVLPSAKRTR